MKKFIEESAASAQEKGSTCRGAEKEGIKERMEKEGFELLSSEFGIRDGDYIQMSYRKNIKMYSIHGAYPGTFEEEILSMNCDQEQIQKCLETFKRYLDTPGRIHFYHRVKTKKSLKRLYRKYKEKIQLNPVWPAYYKNRDWII